MKLLPAFLGTLALSLSLAAAPFTQSDRVPNVDADATLVSGELRVERDTLVITLKSAGANLNEWIHVFSDTGDATGFFDHGSNKAAGKGLKMLIEGNLIYRFTGNSPNTWAWTPIAGATVARELQGNTLTLRVPVSALALTPGFPVHFFAASYTPNYQDTLDTLPRDEGVWSFTPSARP